MMDSQYYLRDKRAAVFAGVLVLIVLTGCGAPYACPAPDPSVVAAREAAKPVIFDGDMAQEDLNALLFLLEHPTIDVLAVTVAATGETHCAPGVEHTLSVLEVGGAADIPVACGPEEPLGLGHEFPAEWRTRVDAAYGIDLPQTDRQPAEGDAAQVIVDTVNGQMGPVTLVAVGPLTNIALALERDPSLVDQVDMLYAMGGTIKLPGNVGPSGVGIENYTAEWNFYADPVAAAQVFESGMAITLVPLDATQFVPITHEFVDCLAADRSTPAMNTVADLLEANRELIDFGGFQFWDSLTAAIMSDDSFATTEMMQLSVVDEEGPQSGATLVDENGAEVRVVTGVDRERFETLFLTVLSD